VGRARKRKREAAAVAMPAAAAVAVPEASTPGLQEELFPEAVEVWRSSFLGPIPPPDVLAGYERVLPGLAERIVSAADAERRHRQATAARLIRLSELGLSAAFVLALTIILCGTYAAVSGAELTGLAAVIATVVGLVAVFVAGRGARHAAARGEGAPDE
jgi:uncharacterized membrane protein